MPGARSGSYCAAAISTPACWPRSWCASWRREDRIVAFRLTSSDRPGLLGKIASLLGDEGANILEVSHGRLFLDVPAKGVSLDVTVETRGEAHSRAIEDMLAKNGFAPRRILPRGLAEPAR